MKKIYTVALFVILCAGQIFFIGCKKKPFYNVTCKDKQLNANVDGKEFDSCVLTVVSTNSSCQINTNNGRSGFSKKYMDISLSFPPATGTYTLGDINANGASASVQIGVAGSVYLTDSIVNTGTITITKYDMSAKRVSGTFSFTGLESPSGGGTKTVSSGEFTDVKLN